MVPDIADETVREDVEVVGSDGVDGFVLAGGVEEHVGGYVELDEMVESGELVLVVVVGWIWGRGPEAVGVIFIASGGVALGAGEDGEVHGGGVEVMDVELEGFAADVWECDSFFCDLFSGEGWWVRQNCVCV
jgi:hypothetical protein